MNKGQRDALQGTVMLFVIAGFGLYFPLEAKWMILGIAVLAAWDTFKKWESYH